MKKIPMPVAVTLAVAAVALAGFMVYRSMGQSGDLGGNNQGDINSLSKELTSGPKGEEVPLEMRNKGVGAGTRNDSPKTLKGSGQ